MEVPEPLAKRAACRCQETWARILAGRPVHVTSWGPSVLISRGGVAVLRSEGGGEHYVGNGREGFEHTSPRESAQ